MKKIVLLLLTIIILISAARTGYCFTSKRYGYSIEFPKGWKVEVEGSTVLASSKYGTSIMVDGDNQINRRIELNDEFAEYYMNNVTYYGLKPYCNRLSLVSSFAGEFNGFGAITGKFKCDQKFVDGTYILHDKGFYTLVVEYNDADKQGFKLMNKSIKTFKINR